MSAESVSPGDPASSPPAPTWLLAGHASPALGEAARMMTICNACRYCEGLCAVFPAMERRRTFADADLEFLASLCHNCGACLYDCQYAPPHEFAVSIPSNWAELRKETYERYAWPAGFGRLFRNNAVVVSVATALAVAVFIIAARASMGSSFTEAHTGDGSFYEVVPHNVMVGVFLAGFLFGGLGVFLSVRRYWQAIGGGRVALGDLVRAGRSVNTLEYLDGGGVGCMNEDEHPNDTRKVFHHLTYYGFALCLAATTLAAVLESSFGQEAPYPVGHPVVILGTVGGLGLLVGPVGLWKAKLGRDPELVDASSRGMEVAFLVMLLLTASTGLAVLLLRSTAAMPLLLAVHLGVVFAFFVTFPYGKFVHGFYRYAALVRHHQES
ncbi:MAG: tricarballylate utilization 4Fe-4S protein TcuB [Actinomycetia bacterium]|nr:tricarballylate utilization 4Fe-4S protein TcuB [Actinomycetes bacterium]